MDKAWAERKLATYLDICEHIKEAVPTGGHWNNQAEALNKQAQLMLVTVEKIMRVVEPSETLRLMPPSYSSHDGESRVRRCLGALQQIEEVEAHLTPDAPGLVADQMHPMIWGAAVLIWNTGQYRVAVGQAALTLSVQIKARANSMLSDRKLVQDVFAPDLPRAGSTRLHLPGNRDDETWKSQQHGLHLLAQGAFSGIRNEATHEAVEWQEHQALEYLSIFSVLARWFDNTVEVRG